MRRGTVDLTGRVDRRIRHTLYLDVSVAHIVGVFMRRLLRNAPQYDVRAAIYAVRRQ